SSAPGATALDQTAFAQPALFVVEYALAKLLEAWGIRPHAMAGHSIGEYAAACLAGVLSLEDALAVVGARGRLMQRCAPGPMLAVALSEAEVGGYLLHGNLDLARVNGVRECVVSGPHVAIAALEAELAAAGVPARLLATSHAFPSSMMETAATELEAV